MTFEERLELVETELKNTKRHNRYLLGAVLLFFSMGIIGATSLQSLKEIRANKFTLEDENGNTCAELKMVDGEPALGIGYGTDLLGNINDVPKILLGMTKGKSTLVMFNENGRPVISMASEEDGPKLRMYDEKGNSRVRLGMTDGEPGLGLGGDGKAGATLAINNGLIGLFLFDKNGIPRLSLGTNNNIPGLTFEDENSKPIWSAP